MRPSSFVLAAGVATLLAWQPAVSDAAGHGAEGPDVPALGTALSEVDLDANRGGQVLQISENQLDAQLHDNSAAFTATGSNIVTNGAFTGATGFPTVIQNSGNNVIIQNATILNLQL
jgi:hypothetical protein